MDGFLGLYIILRNRGVVVPKAYTIHTLSAAGVKYRFAFRSA